MKKFEIVYYFEGYKNEMCDCIQEGVDCWDALARLVRKYKYMGYNICTVCNKEIKGGNYGR